MGRWKHTRVLLARIRARKQKEDEEIPAREREKGFERGETREHKTERRGYILTYLRGKFDYGGGLVVTERLRKGERSWNWLFETRSNETRPLERQYKVFCNVIRTVRPEIYRGRKIVRAEKYEFSR